MSVKIFTGIISCSNLSENATIEKIWRKGDMYKVEKKMIKRLTVCEMDNDDN